MAQTTVATANEETKFLVSVRNEYVRGGRFGKYIGADQNKIIQTNNNINKLSIPLVAKLGGVGVKGSSTLTGNEEALSNYAYVSTPTHKRNGVLINNEEEEKPAFSLKKEARPALMNWAMELKRDEIIQAMGAIEAGGTYYNYGGATGATGSTAASAANMDTWNSANTDRILYGSSASNLSSGDHTTSLGTIDTTNDKTTGSVIRLLKRFAENANPLIRPIMLKGDEPWFVYFCGSYEFRDIQNDLDTNHRDAAPRDFSKNPLWTGGDLLFDGVIIKKVPEIDYFIDGGGNTAFSGVWGANATGDSLATSGASSSRVGVGFLCGAQAISFVIGKQPSFKVRKEDDYGFQNGVAIEMKHDIKKTFFNNKQHGMVTHFTSAAAD